MVKNLSEMREIQAPLSMKFSRQEYQSGQSFPSPGDLPDSGIEPGSPTSQKWGHKELDTTERLNFDFKLPKNKEFPSYDHSSVIRFRNCSILFPGGSDTVKNLPAMPETQVQSLGWEDPLEKGMAAHSGILAWRIPWTEEPGGLQSMESQKSQT